MTPMQEQYHALKKQHPDHIMLYRLGDFYETFEQDAHVVSNVLGLTLTGRGKGESRIPMAGIPYHALDNYLPKLLAAGHKVALVEQLSDPQPGKKLVERAVTKVFTPGTVTLDHSLSESQANFLAAIFPTKNKFGICFVDVSTGEIYVWESESWDEVELELVRQQVKEVVIPEVYELGEIDGITLSTHAAVDFGASQALQLCEEQYSVKTMKGFGISDESLMLQALGGAIGYLHACHRAALEHLQRPKLYPLQTFMRLDQYTLTNLEILQPRDGQSFNATVYAQLNGAQTSMGRRLLKSWLTHPLVQAPPLQHRWEQVHSWYQQPELSSQIQETLSQISDVERIMGRVGTNSANARDLVALKDSLLNMQTLSWLVSTSSQSSALQIEDKETITNIVSLIERGINSEPPHTLTDGHLIAAGFNAEVDELRDLRNGGKQQLAAIQAREIQRTGISSLKVSYNKVFGYYIEITHSHVDKVPADYIRKQTLTGAERYITPELKEWEEKVLTAEDRLLKLEYELFQQIRLEVAQQAEKILLLANAVAELDLLVSWGVLARNKRWSKPTISSTPQINISAGRHVVVENLQGNFTANDIQFAEDTKLILLTGPNMSGKSTFIRQVALIVLQAQIGCFVPADALNFSLIDRIFTRVGAGDNLARGESTFMVEMQETANILNNATDPSLVILDEVGRGTSTYDGVALAWSIASYLVNKNNAFTLFATHYHELLKLAEKFAQVKNQHVEVVEDGDKVIFTHKVKSGGTNRSFGVHVAALAGVPKPVLQEAEKILQQFEIHRKQIKTTKKQENPEAPQQLSLL